MTTARLLIVFLVLAGAVALGLGFARWVRTDSTPGSAATTASVAADGSTRGDATSGDRALPDRELHPVVIRRPTAPARVDSGVVDTLGRPVTLACSDCHSIRPSDPTTRTAADLDEFHQHLRPVHGTLACIACHDPDNADQLRLADGSPVAFEDVITLCSQCHGLQRRAYDHGAHGGMTGFWDRTRGPQVRNTCTDCHDPHAPAFPRMQPTFKSIDRFLTPESGQEAAPHG